MQLRLAEIVGRRFDDPAVLDAVGVDDPPALEPEEGFEDDDRAYVELQSKGVCLVVEGECICAVQLYAGGKDGYSSYEGPILEGVAFDKSRKDLRALLGSPSSSGEADTIPGLGEMPPWDRWSLGDLGFHAEYEFDSGAVRLFTIDSARDWTGQ